MLTKIYSQDETISYQDLNYQRFFVFESYQQQGYVIEMQSIFERTTSYYLGTFGTEDYANYVMQDQIDKFSNGESRFLDFRKNKEG